MTRCWLWLLLCGYCAACGKSQDATAEVSADAGTEDAAIGANPDSEDAGQLGLDAGKPGAALDASQADASHTDASDAGNLGGEADAGMTLGDASSPGEDPPDSDAGSEPDFITGLEPTDPYPASVYPEENPYSAEKALLGKMLFWEEQISSHDTHACGTCHQPGAGGSDGRAAASELLGAGPNGIFGDSDDARGSLGVVRCDVNGTPKADPVYGLELQLTPRKTPSALDAWFYDELFWDGRAATSFIDPVTGEVAIQSGGALESQAAGPPISDAEMSCEGYGWVDIEAKLSGASPLSLASEIPRALVDVLAEYPTYPALFEWAYGTPEVTAQRIIFAIATYERQLRSDQTPWDRYNAGDTTALTAEQEAGLALFNVKARCATCHVPPLFTDNKFHNIGAHPAADDPGRSAISGDPADLGKMKTPSLRNVGLRAPGGLLHSGADNGATLSSVLSLYRQGGIHFDNLAPEIKPMNLPEYEFNQLMDFIQNGLTDPRAAAELPPFDRPRLNSEQ